MVSYALHQSVCLILRRSYGGLHATRCSTQRRRPWRCYVPKGRCASTTCAPGFFQAHFSFQVLGMIQNMSIFTCPHCDKDTHIFGSNGVERECTRNDLRFLGDIPLHAKICNDADQGKPTVVSEPDSSRAKAFIDTAKTLSQLIGI